MNGLNCTCTRIAVVLTMLSLGGGPIIAGSQSSGEDPVIRESAVLEAGQSTVLRSDVASPTRVLTVVPDGQMVGKGDLLVEFDSSSFAEEQQLQTIRLFEANAHVKAAEMALEGRERESRQTVAIAEGRLNLAEAALATSVEVEFPSQLASAESEVQRAQTMLASLESQLLEKNLSETPASREEMAILEVKMRLEAAHNRLDLLREHVHPQRKGELELAVVQARLTLEHNQHQWDEETHQRQTELTIARMRLELESTRMEHLEQQIAGCEIHAPHAGIVRYEWRPVEGDSMRERLGPGTLLYCQQPIVRVESMEHPRLILRTPPEVADKVRSGRKATIRFHAMPQQTFRGHVTEVRMQPSASGGPPQGQIVVQVDNPNEALRLGMSAAVEIEP